MNYGEGGLSASDVALLQGNGRSSGDGIFGDNGAWFIILFLIFAIFGWGRGGYGDGGFNGGGTSVYEGYVLSNDFSQIERKLDGIANGICDSTFALNNTIVNGNAAIQQTLTQGFSGLNTGMVQQGYETRIGINGIGTQLASCCCELKGQIADNKYEMAKGFCSTNNAIAMSTRDIVDNMNANYRALHDEIVANRIEDKNAQITAQQNEINALRLAASQEKQNAYLLSELKPCPSAAYIVPNPNCCYNYQVTQSGCNCGNY